jgi:hypothetical protein
VALRRLVESQEATQRLNTFADSDERPDLEVMKALQSRVTTLLGDQLWKQYPNAVFVRDALLTSFNRVESTVLHAFGLQRDLQHAIDACAQGSPLSRETIEMTLNEASKLKVAKVVFSVSQPINAYEIRSL